MIFISYRREDSRAEVEHLHKRLSDRYGNKQVFVDVKDIPLGTKWPDKLQQKLNDSLLLLVVIGNQWGQVKYTNGKNAGRLRLDDKDDWVRKEICTGIRQENKIKTVVILIDNAILPETIWNCELDLLQNLQQARVRNEGGFEKDFNNLCEDLEQQIPELKRAAELEKDDNTAHQPPAQNNPYNQMLQDYLKVELRNYQTIQLPLISQSGRPLVVPMSEILINLPLIISHQHEKKDQSIELTWIEHEILYIYEQLRGTHTNALWVDRASYFDDIKRDSDIGEMLKHGSRLVIIGDPGCGKTTLLQWVTHHYASHFSFRESPTVVDTQDKQAVVDTKKETPSKLTLPFKDWFPILIQCRELTTQPLPTHFEDVLRIHLKGRALSEEAITYVIPNLEELMDNGKAILLIDGLDEIPKIEQRLQFCRLLTLITNRFPNLSIIITSRIIGFQPICDELTERFDHLLVGPLDRAAKHEFIDRWAKFMDLDSENTKHLTRRICYHRSTAKLSDNIFLLAMIVQIQMLDHTLPGRRVDIYRRALQLMIQRRRPYDGLQLSQNEVIPHLEFLAYQMRKQGVQRYNELEVIQAFKALRTQEPDEEELCYRTPRELMQVCIDPLGILNIAGTEVDDRGYERQVIQFFHQSFQEYFAGQAINHGYDSAGSGNAVTRLQSLLSSIEIKEREVNIWGQYKITELVIADYWQEAVRMAIADMSHTEADEAILMLLSHTPMSLQESRPRSVFALQCLADEPKISEETVQEVFNAVIDNIQEGDGSRELNTWMDEALAAASESIFNEALNDHLIKGFINGNEEKKRVFKILCQYANHLTRFAC